MLHAHALTPPILHSLASDSPHLNLRKILAFCDDPLHFGFIARDQHATQKLEIGESRESDLTGMVSMC